MRWELYDLKTGLFTGQSMVASEEVLSLNRPEGYEWISGVSDWESQRVDLAAYAALQDLLLKRDEYEFAGLARKFEQEVQRLRSALLIEYTPPSPGDDYEWLPDRKRHRLKPEVAQSQAKRLESQIQIDALELSSLRALRELRVAEVDGKPRPDDAAVRLKQIEAEIDALRAAVKS